MNVAQRAAGVETTSAQLMAVPLRSPKPSQRVMANAPVKRAVASQAAACKRMRGSRRSNSVIVSASAASAAAGSDSKVYDVVVVGGGISGLSTGLALRANHKGTSFVITEGRDRVGGNITTRQEGGYIWEEGPNSFQPGDPILQAAVDADVADKLVLGDPKAPRFVWWEGKLRPTPSGPDALTFDLLSVWGKIRAGLVSVRTSARSCVHHVCGAQPRWVHDEKGNG